MLKFFLSNELFIRAGRLVCLVTPAAGILWRMYAYLETHTVGNDDYAVMPVMCGLTALFLSLAGIAWSIRSPAERGGGGGGGSAGGGEE
jgi:hypothetical protein